MIATVSSYFLGGKSPIANLIQRASPGPSSGGDPAKEVRVPDQQQKQQGTREATAISIFPANSELSLSVYLSAGQLDLSRPSLPHHTFEPVRFGDWNFSQTWETSFKVPAVSLSLAILCFTESIRELNTCVQSVQNNGTLIAEMFLSVGGATIDPRDPSYDVTKVSHTRKLLSRYAPERRVKAVKNLLGSHNRTEDEIKAEEAEASRPLQITSFYHPNLTLALINEPMLAMTYLAFPPAVQQHVRLAPGMPDPEKLPLRRYMYPIVFPHDFWLLKEHMQPINDTVEELPLRIDFWPQSAWKFQLFATMDASMQEASKTGQSGAAELDEVKRMLTETNPILLVTTLVVTLLHTLFEFLAFSSDVSHWRKKKELVGVSVRTILANVFVQLVILLYLVDNNENTSWVILGSSGVGLAIEAWKITKAVDIKVLPAAAGSLLPYKLEVHDKHVLSEEELKTQEYDRLAFRLVSYVTIPLLGGYTIYSVIYETHRGWYSFIITTLTQFVYMFGFVQLVPQLM